jgi:hypothetical protein
MNRWFLLGLLVCWLALPITAQEDGETETEDPPSFDLPLAEMLALVPDTLEARETLSYANYAGIAQAHPSATRPESYTEFLALDNAADEGLQRWLSSAMGGLVSGWPEIGRAIRQAEEAEAVVGFDLFDIDHSLTVFNQPARFDIFYGDFEEEAIITAHENRDYTLEAEEPFIRLQPPGDPFEINLAEQDYSNLFGGELGRRQPVGISENMVFSSPSPETLDAAQNTLNGDRRALIDSEDVQTIVEIIVSDDAVIRQMTLLSPTFIGSGANYSVPPSATFEQREAILAQAEADFIEMPQYQLVAITDHATPEVERTRVILVYLQAEDAQQAADVWIEKFEAYESLMRRSPLVDFFNDDEVRQFTYETSVYTSELTGFSAAILTIENIHPIGIEDEIRMPYVSGQGYRLLMQTVFQRDLGWLAAQW